MIKISLKVMFFMTIFFLNLNLFAQLNGEHYIYEHDTLIYSDDLNIYEVNNLGSNVNSEHVESGPRISPDGKSLYFFRVDHPENIAGTEDIWVSKYNSKDSSWSEAKHMDEPLNCHGQNAVHWISKDGKTLLLHNIYYKNGTVGNGVSISYKKGANWSFPKKLKIKGYKNHEVCSFFMNDNMDKLIMCIQQKDSKGHQDLYVSSIKGKSGRKWSKPKNMGADLNTTGTEATAWLNHREDTIYFSSNGHKNKIGGMDIYRSIRLDSNSWTKWSKPVNLGKPYNTTDDEYYFSIPDEGDYIYMAHHFESNVDTSSHSDIVRIRLKELFVEPYLIVTGKLFDAYTKDSIPGVVTFKVSKTGEVYVEDTTDGIDDYYAKLPGMEKYSYQAVSTLDNYLPEEGIIDVTNLTKGIEEKTLDIYLKRKPGLRLTGKIFNEITKDSINGDLIIYISGTDEIYKTVNSDSLIGYDVFLPAGIKYDLKYNSKGYISKIETLDLTDLNVYKEQVKNVELLPLEEGIVFKIKNIFFALDKADLLPKSFVELNNLVKIMDDYPMITVEISGHTDSQGSDEYNKDLSQRRSQSVVDYLIKHGISKKQFVAKGYGEDVPVATNSTKEGRQLNRRVEFKILKINK